MYKYETLTTLEEELIKKFNKEAIKILRQIDITSTQNDDTKIPVPLSYDIEMHSYVEYMLSLFGNDGDDYTYISVFKELCKYIQKINKNREIFKYSWIESTLKKELFTMFDNGIESNTIKLFEGNNSKVIYFIREQKLVLINKNGQYEADAPLSLFVP